MNADPVFVTGVQRSGTTLVGRIVASHPRASFTVNGKILYAALQWLRLSGRPACELSHVRADEMLHALRRKPILGVPQSFVEDTLQPCLQEWAQALARDREAFGPGGPADAIRALLRSVHERLRPGAAFWGDKYNEYMLMFGEVHQLYPAARWVVVRRDREAAARSMLRAFAGRPWCPTDVEGARRKYDEWTEEWVKVRRGLPADRWMELEHERLVAEPRAALAGLARFLGLPEDAFAAQEDWIRKPEEEAWSRRTSSSA